MSSVGGRSTVPDAFHRRRVEATARDKSLFCRATGDHRESVTVAEDATLDRPRRLPSER